jgi:hypothetical protein
MENLKINTVDYKMINKVVAWARVKKERRQSQRQLEHEKKKYMPNSKAKVKLGTRLTSYVMKKEEHERKLSMRNSGNMDFVVRCVSTCTIM